MCPMKSVIVFDQAIQDAAETLRALSNMEVFAEKHMQIGSGLDAGESKAR